VLGVYFAQTRIYDAADRRWLSTDPHWSASNRIYWDDQFNSVPNFLAIKQSANLYMYVLDNPLSYSDLLGLWGKAVHEGKTIEWAGEGTIIINKSDAEIIGRANAGVDSLFGKNPIIGGGLSVFAANEVSSWHFNTDATGDSRDRNFEREKETAIQEYKRGTMDYQQALSENNYRMRHNLLSSAIKKWENALTSFGKGLHALQDKYAHLDWSPPSSPHTAYLDKVGCIDLGTGNTGLFDNPDYDLQLEYRQTVSSVFRKQSWDYVYIAREGNERITNTENATKRAFEDFVSAVDYGNYNTEKAKTMIATV